MISVFCAWHSFWSGTQRHCPTNVCWGIKSHLQGSVIRWHTLLLLGSGGSGESGGQEAEPGRRTVAGGVISTLQYRHSHHYQGPGACPVSGTGHPRNLIGHPRCHPIILNRTFVYRRNLVFNLRGSNAPSPPKTQNKNTILVSFGAKRSPTWRASSPERCDYTFGCTYRASVPSCLIFMIPWSRSVIVSAFKPVVIVTIIWPTV